MIQTTPQTETSSFPAMNIEAFQSLEVPLKKLIAWNENVRKTKAEEGIEELAASIATHGLLQSLVVRKQRGKYAVVAGRRRLLALSLLARQGAVSDTYEVPCRIARDQFADLTEMSLAENVVRQEMHPADQFEAFQRLVENGKTAAEIAARFGVSEAIVTKRLALAKVSPRLLQEYREGELTLDLLQAFTLTDDHVRQEEVWDQIHSFDRNPAAIRRLLSHNDIPAFDKRVRFVGLACYQAAGGFVRRDLFAEEEQGVYLGDPALLQRLVSEKLQSLAETAQAEGWKWVEVQPDINYSCRAKMRQLSPERVPLTAERQAEITALRDEQERLERSLELSEEDTEEEEAIEAVYQRLGNIQDRIFDLEQSALSYSPERKATCGVSISIRQDGEPQYTFGLLRPEEEQALRKDDPGAVPESTTGDSTQNQLPEEHKDESPYSAALLEYLTQSKTAAIAAELADQPDIALASVVYGLILQQFGLDLQLYRAESSVQITTRQPVLSSVQDEAAGQALHQQRQNWMAILPRNSVDLWRWCLRQEQETLLRLLAFCAALSFNAVQTKADTPKHSRLQQANEVGRALRVEMTNWFTPTAANFFLKIPKPRILTALAEAGKMPNIDVAQLKKADIAAMAETALRGTGWLPEPVRITNQLLATENGDVLAGDPLLPKPNPPEGRGDLEQ